MRGICLPLGLTPCSPGAAAIECPVWLEVAPPYPCPVLRTVAFPALSTPADRPPSFPLAEARLWSSECCLSRPSAYLVPPKDQGPLPLHLRWIYHIWPFWAPQLALS